MSYRSITFPRAFLISVTVDCVQDRPEHIPPFYPAAHPDWTTEGTFPAIFNRDFFFIRRLFLGADYLAVMKPSTSVEKKGFVQ